MSRVYRDPRYAGELAGKGQKPQRKRAQRMHRHQPRDHQHYPHDTAAAIVGVTPADPRGVLYAINEYELMRAFGGWWQLTGEHPDVVVIARMQLVMAGYADAERKMQAEMEERVGDGSGSSSTTPRPGTTSERRQTVSVARSEYTRKTPVYPRPDPLAG